MDTNDQMISRGNQKGFVLIWFVMLIPVILLFALMAVDFTYMYVVKGQLQNAADSAALAGAARLVRDDGFAPAFDDMTGARNRAVAFALTNKAAGQNVVINKDTDITFGYWDVHYTTPSGTYVNAIQVRAARDTASAGGQVPIVFGKYFGWDKMGAAAMATAAIPARATSTISLCFDFCRGGVSNSFINYTTAATPPILMDTSSSTPTANMFAWTSYDSNVTSSSDVRDLICNQTAVSRSSCNKSIYSSMGTQASSLCNLEAQMYNPFFDSDNKDYVAKGINTTGWWLIVPITESCPPGAQGNAWDPKNVRGYTKVHVLAICTNGCGSGSIKAPCSNYSAPPAVCNKIAAKYGIAHNVLQNKMVIDKLWCVDCGSNAFFVGRRPVLVSE